MEIYLYHVFFLQESFGVMEASILWILSSGMIRYYCYSLNEALFIYYNVTGSGKTVHFALTMKI